MTGHGNGDRAQEDLLRRALTDAMEGTAGPEPGMPDLLGPAMAEGTRIRRRRRATLLVALSTAAVLVAGGVAGGFAYVGRDGAQGVQVPPGGQPSAGPQQAVDLAALIDGYLAPHGWSAHPVPLEVRSDGAGERTVRILVRSGENPGAPGAVLEISVAAMRRPLAPGQSVGQNCDTLGKLDPSGPESAAGAGVTCRFVGTKEQPATWAWDVSLKHPVDAAASRLWGSVRLGAGTEIVRAWSVIDYFPAAPNLPSPPFDPEFFTALTADPKLVGLVRGLSDVRAVTSTPTGTTNP